MVVEQVHAAGDNLDIKNPHDTSVAHTDPDELLADYQLLMTDLQQTRDRLKNELFEALQWKEVSREAAKMKYNSSCVLFQTSRLRAFA